MTSITDRNPISQFASHQMCLKSWKQLNTKTNMLYLTGFVSHLSSIYLLDPILFVHCKMRWFQCRYFSNHETRRILTFYDCFDIPCHIRIYTHTPMQCHCFSTVFKGINRMTLNIQLPSRQHHERTFDFFHCYFPDNKSRGYGRCRRKSSTRSSTTPTPWASA